jgi:hypothetical protein
MKKYILGLAAAFAFFAAGSAFATTSPGVCAAPVSGTSGGLSVSSTYIADQTGTLGNTGCNVLITFGAGGAVSTSFPNAAVSYDSGADDNIVGIINNSGQVLPSLILTGTSDAFGFESDGACGLPGFTFNSQGPGGATYAGACGIVDSSGYGDNGITFSVVDFNNGTVNFAGGGIANGGTAWFSLEGPVDVNIASHISTVPEPNTLMLVGSGLIGLAGTLRRKLLS